MFSSVRSELNVNTTQRRLLMARFRLLVLGGLVLQSLGEVLLGFLLKSLCLIFGGTLLILIFAGGAGPSRSEWPYWPPGLPWIQRTEGTALFPFNSGGVASLEDY